MNRLPNSDDVRSAEGARISEVFCFDGQFTFICGFLDQQTGFVEDGTAEC